MVVTSARDEGQHDFTQHSTLSASKITSKNPSTKIQVTEIPSKTKRKKNK